MIAFFNWSSHNPEMTSKPTQSTQADRPSRGAAFAADVKKDGSKRQKSKTLKPLAMLWPLAARHPVDLLLAVVFLVAATGISLSLTAAARVLVDQGFATGTSAAVNHYFLIVIGVAILLALFSACRYYFVTKLGERIVANLRQAVFTRLVHLSPSYYLRVRTGEALSRLNTDAALIETLVTSSASIALRNSLMVVGALLLLLTTSPKLTALMLVMVPLTIVPLFIYGRTVRKLSVETQDKLAHASALAGESIEAIETVQAFGREQPIRHEYDTAIDDAFAASKRRIRARAIMTALVIALIFGGIAAVMWMGATAVMNGDMTGGELAQFVLLSIFAASGFGSLGEVWGDAQKAAGAAERMAEILAEVPVIRAPQHPIALPQPVTGGIAFNNVTFAYPSRQDLPALRDLSFTVTPGETVALVGPSGGGKSTVFRLLLRFYDPQTGTIQLDNVPISDTDPEVLRQHFAHVAQDAALFSSSAHDNIAFGARNVTRDQVIAAAKAAEADGFITALPQGYDTPLGEKGRTLSGGQRQRVAIARALVRNAPVMLLDEATSALDAENERLVQKALDTAMQGCTTLVIAHRLATVQRADRILVLDQGQIVEQGTHDSLVADGGLYAKLAKLQFNT